MSSNPLDPIGHELIHGGSRFYEDKEPFGGQTVEIVQPAPTMVSLLDQLTTQALEGHNLRESSQRIQEGIDVATPARVLTVEKILHEPTIGQKLTAGAELVIMGLQSGADGFSDAKRAVDDSREVYLDAIKTHADAERARILTSHDHKRQQAKANNRAELAELDHAHEEFSATTAEQGRRMDDALNGVLRLKNAYAQIAGVLRPIYKALDDNSRQLAQDNQLLRAASMQVETLSDQQGYLNREADELKKNVDALEREVAALETAVAQIKAEAQLPSSNQPDMQSEALPLTTPTPYTIEGAIYTAQNVQPKTAEEQRLDAKKHELASKRTELARKRDEVNGTFKTLIAAKEQEETLNARVGILNANIEKLNQLKNDPEAQDQQARRTLKALWASVDGIITMAELQGYITKRYRGSEMGKEIVRAQTIAEQACSGIRIEGMVVDDVTAAIDYVRSSMSNRLTALQQKGTDEYGTYTQARDQLGIKLRRELRIIDQNEANAKAKIDANQEKKSRKVRAQFDQLNRKATQGRTDMERARDDIQATLAAIQGGVFADIARAQGATVHTEQLGRYGQLRDEHVTMLHAGKAAAAAALASLQEASSAVDNGAEPNPDAEVAQEHAFSAAQQRKRGAIERGSITTDGILKLEGYRSEAEQQIAENLAKGDRDAKKLWGLMEAAPQVGAAELQVLRAGLGQVRTELEYALRPNATANPVELINSRIEAPFRAQLKQGGAPAAKERMTAIGWLRHMFGMDNPYIQRSF